MTICGETTRDGRQCGVTDLPCRYHARREREALDRAARRAAPPPGDPPVPPGIERALEQRDLREVLWRLLEDVLRRPDDGRRVVSVAALGRLIHGLGPEPGDRERALKEVAVIGSVAHGFAPRGEEEWRIAAELFDEATLRELGDTERWQPLGGWFDTLEFGAGLEGGARRDDTAAAGDCPPLPEDTG